MVEPLKELNKICQKPDYKKTGNWMVRHILRDAALPCTWLLLHTSVTANQVTSFALMTGLAAGFFLILPGAGAFLAGALLLQFWYYLDHVDGQIARYRGTASLTGRFYDFLMHHVVHAVVVLALGLYVFRQNPQHFIPLYGALTATLSIVTFNMVHDIKSKAFIERLLREDFRSKPSVETTKGEEKPRSAARRVFSMLHKSFEIHVLMNIFTFFALLGSLFSFPDMRAFLFYFYAGVIPLITVLKLIYFISRKKIDEEFNGSFELLKAADGK